METAKITPIAQEFNGETGEIIIRNLTADELAQRELDAIQTAQIEAVKEAKIAARQSALAKLAAIGLTQEEIEAL